MTVSSDLPVEPAQFEQLAADFRAVGQAGMHAWFGAGSLSAGARLIDQVVRCWRSFPPATELPLLDLRGSGVLLRTAVGRTPTAADLELARSASAAASELGLTADPTVPQQLGWCLSATDPRRIKQFWVQATSSGRWDGGPDERQQRHPPLTFEQVATASGLRGRLHADIAVPPGREPELLKRLILCGGRRPRQGRSLVVDAAGNEIDLLAGEALDRFTEMEDWTIVFGAQVAYPVDGLDRGLELVTRVAELSDLAGFELLIDLRPDMVLIDTGKDRWEDDRFDAVASGVQRAARELGLVADRSRVWFFQIGVDAVDVPHVRAFWRAALGYRNDEREFVTDLTDPRQLNHPVFFQPMQADDRDRLAQRDRIHAVLTVPDDQLDARRAAALDSGGHELDDGSIADSEGHRIALVSGLAAGRRPARP